MKRTVDSLTNTREETKMTLALCRQRIRLLEEDRERIKRDLHDGILQTLYSSGLGMAAAKLLMTTDLSQAAAQAGLAAAQLDRAVREIREFLNTDLGAQDENAEPLETQIRTLVESAVRMTPMACEIDLDPHSIDFIPKAARSHLVYILREAMSNCIRHAQADSMLVSLTMEGEEVSLVVEDNGSGFTYQHSMMRRHGLKNLMARAHQIGGRLDIHSMPGQGTRLVLKLDRSAACLHSAEGAFTH